MLHLSLMMVLSLLFLLLAIDVVCGHTHPDHGFPLVNLGYAVHSPTHINTTSNGIRYASYNNIRFAEPPLGARRFRRPETPPRKQPGIQDGWAPPFSTDCVSAVPGIFPDPGSNKTAWGSEDCLFLNVRVPEGVKEGDNVPVVHWIHGSGFVYGSKDFSPNGDGWGLFENMSYPDQRFIYVASNYRMGMFGWASSPTEDMDANIGLWDTEAALRWTREHISKFGGDPERITAFGESAGAGIIELLLVSYRGETRLPFSQAFISSPAYWPRRDPTRRQAVFSEVLKVTNCTSVACLRDSSEQSLFDANAFLITNLTTGSSVALGPTPGFTPVVDQIRIPDILTTLLSAGQVSKDIKRVVVGNMLNEGMFMSPPGMPDNFGLLVRETIPNADNNTITKIQSLYDYPPDLPQKLAWDWTTDISFACSAYFTAEVYRDTAQRFVMSIPPAAHGQDINYWFFRTNSTTPVTNLATARNFQEYVRRFVTGAKNLEEFADLADWPTYGADSLIFNVTADGFVPEADFWATNGRCQVLNEIFSKRENGA